MGRYARGTLSPAEDVKHPVNCIAGVVLLLGPVLIVGIKVLLLITSIEVPRAHQVAERIKRKPLPLLRSDGRLTEPGWARQPFWRYRRAAVHAASWRIKEWDYYSVVSPEGYGFALTASNLGYAGRLAASERLLAARQQAPFRHVEDLCRRAQLDAGERHVLAAAVRWRPLGADVLVASARAANPARPSAPQNP